MDREKGFTVKEYQDKLPVLNFDHVINVCNKEDDGEQKKKKKRHGPLLPNNIRCLIVGPSNCGKTNTVFNLLFSPNGVRFCNVYVFSKSLYQEKYKFLENILSSIPSINYFPFTDNDEVPPPETLPSNSLMIFDDVICEKQNNITSYFTMGRHNNIDIFYLSQTYSKIPKQLIRDNANFIILFRQDELNLKHIYRDHVAPDMTIDKFKAVCDHVWSSNKNGFLTIDKESLKNKGRYRNRFDSYISTI
jgi:hypothetical protein